MNIFVGNLLFEATEKDLKKLFDGFGRVAAASIVMEKKGKKSRGFGFVEMPDECQAKAAILALDGKDFMGRVLNVSPARSKKTESRTFEKRRENDIEPKEEIRRRPDAKRFFRKKGTYKSGRRSRSYLRRQAQAQSGNSSSERPPEARSWQGRGSK
jgi:RNA recognition motif-containing protein